MSQKPSQRKSYGLRKWHALAQQKMDVIDCGSLAYDEPVLTKDIVNNSSLDVIYLNHASV